DGRGCRADERAVLHGRSLRRGARLVREGGGDLAARAGAVAAPVAPWSSDDASVGGGDPVGPRRRRAGRRSDNGPEAPRPDPAEAARVPPARAPVLSPARVSRLAQLTCYRGPRPTPGRGAPP